MLCLQERINGGKIQKLGQTKCFGCRSHVSFRLLVTVQKYSSSKAGKDKKNGQGGKREDVGLWH